MQNIILTSPTPNSIGLQGFDNGCSAKESLATRRQDFNVLSTYKMLVHIGTCQARPWSGPHSFLMPMALRVFTLGCLYAIFLTSTSSHTMLNPWWSKPQSHTTAPTRSTVLESRDSVERNANGSEFIWLPDDDYSGKTFYE